MRRAYWKPGVMTLSKQHGKPSFEPERYAVVCYLRWYCGWYLHEIASASGLSTERVRMMERQAEKRDLKAAKIHVAFARSMGWRLLTPWQP